MSVKTNNPILGERLLYILVWAMALLVPILNSKMMSEEHVSLSNILLVWSKLLPYIIIFMINNGLLAPRLLFKRRYIEYFTIALVMLVAIFYPLQYYQDELRMIEYPDGSNYFVHGRASFTDLAWYWNVLLGLLMMGANCSIKFIFRSMQDEQKIAQMERQALQAEMDYLKYQINPHFFMNTLNNIHAMIDIDAEAAKECVIELSKMMRYVLYDSEQVHTNLWQEVEFTENYIELMRIRYAADIDVQFNVQKPLPSGAKVPPLILIVFVENAFKHGVSYNSPSFVHISLYCEGGRAICEVRNSRHEGVKTERGGVGLENVRKRLELIFGRDYTLLIDESKPTEYSVKLSIPMYYDKVHNH